MDAYDVHRRIGQGTFGVVYLAVHRKSGQPVRYDVIFYFFLKLRTNCCLQNGPGAAIGTRGPGRYQAYERPLPHLGGVCAALGSEGTIAVL